MSTLIDKLKHLSRPTPFITSVILISTLPLLTVLYLTYAISEQSLLASVKDNLKLIAKYKASAINTYIDTTQSAAEALSRNPIIIDEVIKMNNASLAEQQQIRKAILPIIESFQELLHYQQIYLISERGNTLLAVLPEEGMDSDGNKFQSELTKAAERAKILMETEMYNLGYDQRLQHQVSLMAVPIANQGRVVGVIALELNNEQIYNILRSKEGAKATMEIVTGIWQENNEISLTTPLRFDKTKQKLQQFQPEDQPMAALLEQASQGTEKEQIFEDYRGREVIAASKYLPALRWGMIVKMDASEAFAPINRLRQSLLWLGGLTVTLLTFLAYLLSRKLQHSQEMLVQQEKLASLGVLTAGVAHEINNPINFISSSISSIKKDMNDVMHILNRYRAATSTAQLTSIRDTERELELDVTIKELDTLLQGVEEGTQRTAAIVKDLKTISRLDEAEMKSVDLHQGIDSTLSLLKHTFKDNIIIHKDYGQIPLVECYPGKLNQVFMNLLANAIQAIESQGTITIKTRHDGNNVEIRIEDTGCGIGENNHSKIFVPFFTTKDVGKGTGLGLAISHAIITDHHGTISFQSQEGKGTEFIVVLPLTQSN